MKAEAESRIVQNDFDSKFDIDDLRNSPGGIAPWQGVRSYEARNNIKEMKVGDKILFYHSNCRKQPPGIVGLATVAREHYVETEAFDPKHGYYDPKSTSKDDAKWFSVDIQFNEKFAETLALTELKACKELQDMQLIRRQRLSVSKVTKAEYNFVVALARKQPKKK